MKGVTTWFWVAAGIIASLLIFSIAYKQIVQLNIARLEQRSLEQYDEVKGIIDNLCWSFGGNEREYTVTLAESVEGMYVATDLHTVYEREELINKILAEENTTGNFLCIKLKDKRVKCQELECTTSMPFIGSVPVEFSLSALVNRIMGRGEVFTYYLHFKREQTSVVIDLLEPNVTVSTSTGYSTTT